MQEQEIIKTLFDVGAVKFGQFKLKSGIQSPIYIDLRVTISYPSLLKAIAEAMWNKVCDKEFDVICGVPYTALPIASYLSTTYDKPMILRRREAKDHGTRNMLEGVIHPGQTCLIFEDLVTSGASVFETIEPLEAAHLKVKDVVVFLDREQGGHHAITQRGYNLHSVVSISELLHTLQLYRCISFQVTQECNEFINTHQVGKMKEAVHG